MKNHYIPRLILRKFSDKLSIYNIESGELKENAAPEKIFFEDNLYSKEIEQMLNKNIEGPFADLLNNKILKENNELRITRKELLIIKKFFIIASIRTKKHLDVLPMISYFFDYLKEAGFNNYIPILKEFNSYKGSTSKLFYRDLIAILESKSIEELTQHRFINPIVFYSAMTFMSSYSAIWDSSKTDEDFIISDIGYTTETEYDYYPKKLPYIHYELEKAYYYNNHEQIIFYSKIFNSQLYLGDNILLIPMSKKRMLVFINNFFKIYFPDLTTYNNIPDLKFNEISQFKNLNIFEKNHIFYKNTLHNLYAPYKFINDEDIFSYKVKYLKKEDVIYTNILMLDRIDKFLGFSDLLKLKNSIIEYKNYYEKSKIPPKVNYLKLYDIMREKQLL